jgi:hypothetical protein
MDTSTSIRTHAISLCVHTTTAICPESNVGYATISIRDTTIRRLGAPQSSVFDRLAPPVQDRLSAPQSDHQTQAHQDCRTTRPQKVDKSGRGHIPTATKRTTKRDIIKIGTTDVVIQENNEGSMIFGKSANTSKEGDTTRNNQPKILHASMVPIGTDTVSKAKIATLENKGEQGK